MKKLALLLCAAFLVASVASAAQAPAPPATKSAVKTHVVEAEVVSVDVDAKTLTIKGDPDKTVPVDAAAAPSLKNVKPGEKVKLTCRDNAQGDHEAVTHIEKKKTM